MALTLIKEDGTGKPDANSYADVTDGDGYHDGHLYATAWTGATADRKAAALVMATRLIDSQFQFNGGRTSAAQALQWPRTECPDPDKGLLAVSVLLPILSDFVDYNAVPSAVVQATCEMARELLVVDRTASPPGEGLDSVQTIHATHAASGTGSSSDTSATKYSKVDTRPIISHVAQAMLAKFGALMCGSSGMVRLTRA
ncbi:MAG TPA: DnaT-like ssDNA-binding protein [Candidatus Acidoferrum sp.]|nr:DnaT-like ssDNA-binding protein [Candidatus Acidoferrum sp.]